MNPAGATNFQHRFGPDLTASKELIVLCALLQERPDVTCAHDLIRCGFDWGAVASLAGRHGVRPRLLAALKRADFGDEAAPLIAELGAFQRSHVPRRLHFAAEIVRLASALRREGLAFAAFKGVTLAVDIYGDLAAREFNDIDLLVSPADREAASRVLLSFGYVPPLPDAAMRETFLAYQRQYLFRHPGSDGLIDLHWGFVPAGLPFPLRAEEVWPRLSSVAIAGQAIPTLGSQDLALFLAGHGRKEEWRSLGWILDFALLIDRRPDLDWREIWALAQRRQCGQSVLLGLLLAWQFFDARVDAGLIREALADAAVKQIARRIAVQIASHQWRSASDEHLASFQMCETAQQKAKVAWHFLTTRTIGDYESLPLPRPLWRLYHLTRPLRLLTVVGVQLRGTPKPS